ncbi:glycosyltransferase family 2 protein [Phocaeicola coprocola]|jgi:GT2 family glycosyltransferase|uniref:glycosyltransferase family 2 protein n=1 Tax=Phocaeicola coprocola TaxID=310298 RepID=UPI0026DC0FDA|nr:glycosyltransferase family 2 protein [Phocaeicola coprocola]
MQTIAVLLTVFNRKDKTLKCLEQLYNQLPLREYQVDIYLTNDGCTDGTPEAINQKYPQIHIIQGTGNLFWNRGMYLAWQEAAKNDYDFYLWLNDDTLLLPNAINTLLNESQSKKNQAIIIAPNRALKEAKVTYSGYNKQGKIVPNGSLQPCDTFNGNCVLIPKFVFQILGNLDWRFRHAIGDLDYGYRAKKAGIKMYVSSDYLGVCDNNPQLPAWARKEVPIMKRIKNLYSPLGYAEPLPFFHFERRNFGLITAIKHFVSIHIRVLFPQLWKH